MVVQYFPATTNCPRYRNGVNLATQVRSLTTIPKKQLCPGLRSKVIPLTFIKEKHVRNGDIERNHFSSGGFCYVAKSLATHDSRCLYQKA